MLKFLTHKLRTHSLNEESVSEKVEERDSGTESDDEADRPDAGDYCTDVIMKWNDVTDLKGSSSSSGACACGGASSPPPPPPAAAALPPPEPDLLYDHHSSEEELEVINGSREGESAPAGPGAREGEGEGEGEGEAKGGMGEACTLAARLESRRRAASSPPAGGGKRKWPRSPHPATQHDDDDDDHKVETPVRFRTSPPLEALKPRRALPSCMGPPAPAPAPAPFTSPGSCAGAPSSPGSLRALDRRRRVAPPRRHRPALDFDKMQQLRVGGSSVSGVRSWRGPVGQGAGGELSVFCW